MHILYYNWFENSSDDIKDCFAQMGFSFTSVSRTLNDYDSDAGFEQELQKTISANSFDLIFTFNYFPILSKIADKCRLPYLCWVYDCPHFTLYSRRVTSRYTFFFVFDRSMCQTLSALGALHVMHMPLAVNTARLSKYAVLPCNKMYPVSFVGSLYEKNMYRRISYLPDNLKGYLDGIINAQQQLKTGSILDELMTNSLTDQLLQWIQLDKQDLYLYTARDIFLSMLEAEVTCRERVILLTLAAGLCGTHLFTASDAALVPDCIPHGFISYTDEMPQIFHHSSININISLRSIHSGIPLRCMDIMGTGGFLLSNDQPELNEYFQPEEDFAVFFSEEDFLEKIAYFSEHEKKRNEIAHNGYLKIKDHFNYPVLFQKMLDAALANVP